ncbi:unnamed protein product [Didymodactylos carnosus]|uniref:Uncharacterized protein n=1 Tax=Didymodactylos carnosus TaxID=1234261 RepID=A0A814ZEB3_9BILA|nr:unnamed protein product [Didymodactylos carnosus]CAF1241201.1 unnamed protein product [Didymodactylos carnosus]CAF3733590.1 unnamed protein product [Didymodactylos carnosus]CAF4004307.1 unnamed protein product [Didymodactylos carnosus]
MRCLAIKTSINFSQKGQVLNWQKHCRSDAQRELESAAKNNRDLNSSLSKPPIQVYNFQDLVALELDGCVPGAFYAAKYTRKHGCHQMLDRNYRAKEALCRNNTITGDRYTLITPPSYQLTQSVRSRCPVLQCPCKI